MQLLDQCSNTISVPLLREVVEVFQCHLFIRVDHFRWKVLQESCQSATRANAHKTYAGSFVVIIMLSTKSGKLSI